MAVAGGFLGRLNTNCSLNYSAWPQFLSRPAVGLMVFRLKIGLFSGLFVCFHFYTFLTLT